MQFLHCLLQHSRQLSPQFAYRTLKPASSRHRHGSRFLQSVRRRKQFSRLQISCAFPWPSRPAILIFQTKIETIQSKLHASSSFAPISPPPHHDPSSLVGPDPRMSVATTASSNRSLLKTIPGLLLSALFLWYTFRGISFNQILALRAVHPAWILGVLGFTLASYTLRCIRWSQMMPRRPH